MADSMDDLPIDVNNDIVLDDEFVHTADDWDDAKVERLRLCLRGLEINSQRLLRLKLDGFKLDRIAKVVRLSPDEVAKRLTKILNKLAKCMEESDPDSNT